MTVFWSDIAIVVIVVLLIVNRRPSAPKAVMWYLLYLLAVLTSLRMNSQPFRQFVILLKLEVAPLVVFLLVYNCVRRDAVIRKIVATLVWFGAALAVITLVNWVRIQNGAVGPFYHPDIALTLLAKDAAQTSFGRSNYIASLLILLIPLALYRTAKAPAAWAALAVMVTALIATQSRGGLISLALAFLIWVGLSMRYLGSSVLGIAAFLARIAICAVLAFVVWQCLPSSITDEFGRRLSDTREAVASGDYAGNRRDVWIPAAQHVMDAPFFGIGYGNEEENPTALDMNSGSAHNLFLQVLLATGAVGLVPFTIFLVSCAAQWLWLLRFSAVREDRILAAAALFVLAAALINCFEEPSFWGLEYSRVLWLVLSMGFVMKRARTSSGQHRERRAPAGRLLQARLMA